MSELRHRLRAELLKEPALPPELVEEVLERLDLAGAFPCSDTVLGATPRDPRGPGVTPFDGKVPTVLLDQLGTGILGLKPSDELAVYLELSGRLNRSPDRNLTTYLLPPGMVGELVASMIVALDRVELLPLARIGEAVARERLRVQAVEGEHRT
jgi:hypothetical protein